MHNNKTMVQAGRATSLLQKKWVLTCCFLLLPILIVGFSILGGIWSYSPVPFWDMWDGTIQFNMNIDAGDYNAWWAPHNEHRIFLSRLLFWVDSHWFGGTSLLLIPLHYVFIGLSCLIFLRGLHSAAGTNKGTTAEFFLGCFLIAWLFSWSQNENLTWGFQSQFILAQLVPLTALYYLVTSIIQKHHHGYFILACILGVAATGTMANGVLALPIMLLYMIMMRQHGLRIGIIALLAAGTLYLYCHNYQTVNGSLLFSLTHHPLDFLNYLVFYLGNPFFYLIGKGTPGKVCSMIAGSFLIISTAYFFIQLMFKPKRATLDHVFLFFLLFICATAFITAGGRLIFGVDQAFSSRYVTPTLMAWAALLLLYAPLLLPALHAKKKVYIRFFALVVMLMMILPLKIFKIPYTNTTFDRNVAALALSLQINDSKVLKSIYPNAEHVLNVARLASQKHLSIFARYPFKDIAQNLGQKSQALSNTACFGAIDRIKPIAKNKHFVRIQGWLYNPSNQSVPRFIRLVSKEQKIVGYAISGKRRADLGTAVHSKVLRAGFTGYVLSQNSSQPISLQGETPPCTINIEQDE